MPQKVRKRTGLGVLALRYFSFPFLAVVVDPLLEFQQRATLDDFEKFLKSGNQKIKLTNQLFWMSTLASGGR